MHLRLKKIKLQTGNGPRWSKDKTIITCSHNTLLRLVHNVLILCYTILFVCCKTVLFCFFDVPGTARGGKHTHMEMFFQWRGVKRGDERMCCKSVTNHWKAVGDALAWLQREMEVVEVQPLQVTQAFIQRFVHTGWDSDEECSLVPAKRAFLKVLLLFQPDILSGS